MTCVFEEAVGRLPSPSRLGSVAEKLGSLCITVVATGCSGCGSRVLLVKEKEEVEWKCRDI